MSLLLISYDLRKPNYRESDYEDLYHALKSLGAKRIQDSVWAVQAESTPKKLQEKLSRHVHDADRLLVAEINGFSNINGITKLTSV
jgi:CRISPR-associated endonuclease Cas2